MPTKHISIPKNAPASGVPNAAPNAAEIPAIMRSRRSWSRTLNSALTLLAMVPPICTAAPSRPAEPPARCVAVEQTKVSRPMRAWMCVPVRVESITRLLPREARRPWLWYSQTVVTLTRGRRANSHRLASRMLVTVRKDRRNAHPATPIRTETTTVRTNTRRLALMLRASRAVSSTNRRPVMCSAVRAVPRVCQAISSSYAFYRLIYVPGYALGPCYRGGDFRRCRARGAVRAWRE